MECWDGGHPEKIIMTKRPEWHKKEIHLRKGIVLVFGGLDWYVECWDGGHPEKRIMVKRLE